MSPPEVLDRMRTASLLATLALSSSALAQGSFFVARTDEFRVNASTSFNQFWVLADVDAAGTTWAVSFVNGQDPVL